MKLLTAEYERFVFVKSLEGVALKVDNLLCENDSFLLISNSVPFDAVTVIDGRNNRGLRPELRPGLRPGPVGLGADKPCLWGRIFGAKYITVCFFYFCKSRNKKKRESNEITLELILTGYSRTMILFQNQSSHI